MAISNRAVPTQQLRLCLEYGPTLPTPAASPAEAVLAVAGTRPDSDVTTSSCPSRRAAAGRGPARVEWPLIAARVRQGRRQSRRGPVQTGVCQS